MSVTAGAMTAVTGAAPSDHTALILAVVGIALSSLSLGWQIAQWLMAGARVRVDVEVGMMNASGAMLGRPGAVDFEQFRRQGIDRPVVALVVRNKGRFAVDLQRYTLQTTNKIVYQQLDMEANPKVPFRLEGHSQTRFFTDAANVIAMLALAERAVGAPKPMKIRGLVELATGREAESDWIEGRTLVAGMQAA